MTKYTTTTHCCIALDGLLKLTLEQGGVGLLEHNNGELMSETEIYQLVKEQKAKGYKYYCDCNNRDVESRCLGHPIEEIENG